MSRWWRSIVQFVVFVPAVLAVGVFSYAIALNLGIESDRAPVRSGVASVQACERIWLSLGMRYQCRVEVRWGNAAAPDVVWAESPGSIADGTLVHQFRRMGPRRMEVWPADHPRSPEWVGVPALLVSIGVGMVLAHRLAHNIGNLLFPVRVRARPAPAIQPHPDTPYRVDTPRQVRALPVGHGGIALRTWFRRWSFERHNVPYLPQVGVDGRPAVSGWGTALVTVPAGRHVVQVQTYRCEAERAVEVTAGAVVQLEYTPSRGSRTHGLLGPPGLRQPGLPPTYPTLGMAFLMWLLGQGVAHWANAPVWVGWAALAAGPGAYCGLIVGKLVVDHHRRLRALGAGASRRNGDVLALTCSFAGPEPDPTRPVWVPPPVVRLDGDRLPAGWSTQWHRLPPGSHELVVAEPVARRTRITLAAGATCRVTYHARLPTATGDGPSEAWLTFDDVSESPPVTAHPASPYPVVPEPDVGDRPPLPAGHGGILVRTWFRTWLQWRRWYALVHTPTVVPPTVGVDGRPALRGWGSALVVVPAGRRLVQVQTAGSEAERMVDAPAGAVVAVEYAAPRNSWHGRGILGPPGLRQPGLPMLVTGATLFLGWLAGYWAAQWYGNPPAAESWCLAVPAGLAVVAFAKRYRDRRTRRLAHGPAVAGDAAAYLVGPAPPPALPDGRGGVLLALSFRREMRRYGQPDLPERDRHAWVPPPQLRVDGRQRPASWSTWWYPLCPGRHRFEIGSPAGATVDVDVTAGGTQHLRYHATIRTDMELGGTVHMQADASVRRLRTAPGG